MVGIQNAKREERFDERQGPPPESTSRGPRHWLIVSLLLALASLIFLGFQQRPLAILCLGAGSISFVFARRHLSSRKKIPTRGLVLQDNQIFFDDASNGPLRLIFPLQERFGVTMLANRSRTRAALAMTSPQLSFYVGAKIQGDEILRYREALATAFTVASDERALDPAGPDGLPLQLSGEALVRLYEELQRVDSGCTRRFFLTDVRGDAVTLDERVLSAGSSSFDLEAKLDWKGLIFQEESFAGVMIYQGTQVRQGAHNLVFVSLMPALSSPEDPGDFAPRDTILEYGTQRDLLLLRNVSGKPPAQERRVAIDRVFMLPLRAALLDAPRSRNVGASNTVV